MTKLLLLATAGYALSSLILLARLKGFSVSPHRAIPLLLAGAATAIHGLLLGASLLDDAGINMGLGLSMSLVGWLSALLVVGSSLNKPFESLGLLVFPLSMLSLWLPAWLPPPHPLPHGIGVHVLASLLAYTLLGLAAAQAALLALQEKRLRNRQWQGLLGALPPLATMERTLFEWLAAGFVALAITLLTGWLFVDDFLGQHLAHKTFFAVLAWLLVAGLLWGHWQRGWRGLRAARLTLWGYGLLVLGYAGSQFVMEVLIMGKGAA